MKPSGVQYALILSLLLNVGVIGAVANRAIQLGHFPPLFSGHTSEASLPDYLKLTPDQRRDWHAMEQGFLHELKADWQQIGNHRERMIQEIFAEQPDRTRIEAERVALAQLQAAQQQRIIEQLLKERTILTREQQLVLSKLLQQQAPASTLEERLHGQ
jgi:Spy/CpxP family protein refolding chaperone